jgi:hypothetical protein
MHWVEAFLQLISLTFQWQPLLPIGQDSIQTDFLDLSMAGYDCIPQAVCFGKKLTFIIASNLQMSSSSVPITLHQVLIFHFIVNIAPCFLVHQIGESDSCESVTYCCSGNFVA